MTWPHLILFMSLATVLAVTLLAYADRFERVFNADAARTVKAQIDMEERDRHTLAAGGWTGIGLSFGMNLVDPTILLPGGALVKGTRAGYRAGRSALSVGTAAGVATGIQEAGLQATQEARTLEESALNIGGSVLLGGFLGAGAAKLASRDFVAGGAAMKRAMDNPEFDAATDELHRELTGIAEVRANLSAAAASVPDTLDDLTIAGKAASAVATATAQLNPVLRTMGSPSKTVRAIASQLMETPVYLRKNMKGEGSAAAETSMQEYTRGAVVKALEAQRAAYSKARNAGSKLTEEQFRQAVGMAMRRGDESPEPGVAEAAKAWRSAVIEPLKERAIKAGLLPSDVTVSTAESYFSRVYNRPLIEAKEGEFKDVVRDWLSGALDEEIARNRARTDKRVMSLQRQKNELETGILRRQSGFQERMQAGEIETDAFSESDIVQLARRVQAGEAPTVPENRILENAEKAATKGFDALTKREQAYMGFLGVGRGVAEDLGRLFKEHGELLDGVRVAHSDAWGDDDIAAAVRRAYRAAINKDVDSIIVTKGVGDVPLLANTPLGRALLQFKSFAIASNQRVLIRGLQEDKARFVGGMVGMSIIGMFIYWLKQKEAGREVSNNPGTWIAEGLDRSGVFSVAFEINNALEKAGAPGAFTASAAMFPESDQRQPASRYAVRSTVGGLLGPSFGGATDAVGMLSLGFENARRLSAGEEPRVTPGDIGTARRLTPFASLPYWRWFIDGMLVPELKEGVR